MRFLNNFELHEGRTRDTIKKLKSHQVTDKEINFLRSKDPSNGKFLPWISKQFMANDIWQKDWEALQKYHTFLINNRIPIEHRDINKIANFTEIEKIITSVERKLTRKEIRHTSKNGAIKLFDNENIMFLRILTAAASKKYGKGTKWCISKKNDDDDFNQRNINWKLYFLYLKKEDSDYYKIAIMHHRDINAKGQTFFYDAKNIDFNENIMRDLEKKYNFDVMDLIKLDKS